MRCPTSPELPESGLRFVTGQVGSSELTVTGIHTTLSSCHSPWLHGPPAVHIFGPFGSPGPCYQDAMPHVGPRTGRFGAKMSWSFPLSGVQALPPSAASLSNDRSTSLGATSATRSASLLPARILLRLGRHPCGGLHPSNRAVERSVQREGKVRGREQMSRAAWGRRPWGCDGRGWG